MSDSLFDVDLADFQRLASGAYQYHRDGTTTDIVEPWAIHKGRGGNEIVASKRSSAAFGFEMDVRAIQDATLRQVRAFDCRYAGVVDVSCSAWIHHGKLDFAITSDGETKTSQRPWLDGSNLFPLMRIFTGPLLASLWRGGGHGAVLLPDISVAPDGPGFLDLVRSKRSAIMQEEAHDGTRSFLFEGGRYESGVSCQVDAGGLLIAYSWRQDDGSLWEITRVEDQS